MSSSNHQREFGAWYGIVRHRGHVQTVACSLTTYSTGACRMGHDKSTDTNHNRDVESIRSEYLGSSPPVRDRPADGQALDEPRAATPGLRALARGGAPVHCSQTSQASAMGRGWRQGTKVEGSDRLLSGEAGGLGPGSGAGSVGVDHPSVSTAGGGGGA